MEYTTLGRTGLRVSRMGLGCGGHSRLGLSSGKGDANAVRIVREAIELGVNFIDTAEGYRTEEVVGIGISDTRREELVISTKAGVHWEERYATPAEMAHRVDECLRRLRTEYIDVFHLHGVRRQDYEYGRDELLPALQKLKEAGKIRFVGITEQFANDTRHEMLRQALVDDVWDVMMVGLNLINQSAKTVVLPEAREHDVGILDMFAVRRALSNPVALRALMTELVRLGQVDPGAFDEENPLDFLLTSSRSSTIAEAAYRYCLWIPGVHVVLSGTGSAEHLRANARSLTAPPLLEEILEKLTALFGRVDAVSGN